MVDVNSSQAQSLLVNRLELMVHLGWPAEERASLQKVYLDMKLTFLKQPMACVNDELTDTVCYQEIIEQLKDHLQKSSFKLLEHLGYVIYQFVKKHIPAQVKLKIIITKFPTIAGLLDGVSFCYGDE